MFPALDAPSDPLRVLPRDDASIPPDEEIAMAMFLGIAQRSLPPDYYVALEDVCRALCAVRTQTLRTDSFDRAFAFTIGMEPIEHFMIFEARRYGAAAQPQSDAPADPEPTRPRSRSCAAEEALMARILAMGFESLGSARLIALERICQLMCESGDPGLTRESFQLAEQYVSKLDRAHRSRAIDYRRRQQARDGD